MTLEFNKRFSHNWQARIAYTFGKVLDTKPDATSVVPGGGDDAKQASDPKNFQADYAPGDADQRHRLVLSAYWSVPYDRNGDALERALFGGWSLSGIVTLASGQPYSPILSPLTDINNDGNNRNDRAPGFSRNSFNYPTFFSIDPRITKDIPIGGATPPADLRGLQHPQPLERHGPEPGLLRGERNDAHASRELRHADHFVRSRASSSSPRRSIF